MKKPILLSLILSIYLNAELMSENFGEVGNEPPVTETEEVKVESGRQLPRATPLVLPTDNRPEPSAPSNIQNTSNSVGDGTPSTQMVANTQEADFDAISNNSVSITGEEDGIGFGHVQEDEIIERVVLKKYSKVKYNDAYLAYSMTEPGSSKDKKKGQKLFKKFLEDNEIDKVLFNTLLNTDSSILALKMNALFYDWYKKDPSIAENFYKKMYEQKGALKVGNKMLLSDYMIRTGRGKAISSVIHKKDCSVIFKGRGDCFYYLGLEEYLKTGDKGNRYLNLAKGKNEKAKKLYTPNFRMN